VASSSNPSVPDVAHEVARLAGIMNTIQDRLLSLVLEGTQKAIPLEDFTGELALLAKGIKRRYHEIKELRDRRDLTFQTLETLQEMDRHCVWLYRKIHLEECFFRKWHLEERLRGLISAEALRTYREILDVDAVEDDVLARDDREIRRILLDETDVSLSACTSLS
jgi:hypothetical protein